MVGVTLRLPILPVLLFMLLSSVPARAEVQVRCEGTLLEARGSAEQDRPIVRLRFSLALEAEQRSSEAALVLLQERLAAVRRALQALQVGEFRASSPSTWQRPAEGGRPPLSHAYLEVSGTLSPERLQALIRQVGTLPGVRLAPVTPEAESAGEAAKTRAALLAAAYQRALAEARNVAGAIGLDQLRPVEVVVEGDGAPVPLRAMRAAAAAPPPFDPAELPPPKAFASMLVRFCAR